MAKKKKNDPLSPIHLPPAGDLLREAHRQLTEEANAPIPDDITDPYVRECILGIQDLMKRKLAEHPIDEIEDLE